MTMRAGQYTMSQNEHKVYWSRIGWELVIPTLALFVFIIYKTGGMWQIVLTLLPIAAFIGSTMFATRYIVSGNKLIIKCGPVVYSEINIGSIHRIRNTFSPLASPAASIFGRMELHYGKGRTSIISPQRKEEFVRDLLSRNNAILT
jgi:hypothetical protein